ncbi:hypothetical protein [Actinomadura hibisca]|uniref:hypothetical protein n=1 Tax=Actinomadura hibisca TaxID=68565 RepID=UPI00082D44BA|nr:hypothetical protein [Actinomadura hibisca]
MKGARPVRRLAADITGHAARRGLEWAGWEFATGTAVPGDCEGMSARSPVEVEVAGARFGWQDRQTGAVRAAVVLREVVTPRKGWHGEQLRCAWALVAEADQPWTHQAPCPSWALGLAGVRLPDKRSPIPDAPGLPPGDETLDHQPPPVAVLALETYPPQQVDQMLARITDPARDEGLLVVTIDRGFEGASVMNGATWPGLITMLLLTEEGRQILSNRLPERQVPAGGGRWYSPAVDRPDDQILGPGQVVRDSVCHRLTDQVLTARSRTAPAGLAADAAVLLTDPAAPLPAACAPPPPDPDTVINDLARQLAQARDGRATAEAHAADLGAELDKATALLRDREQELQQLAARLQEQHAATDAYAAAAAAAEEERDLAVRHRGIAELRLAHAHSANRPADRPADRPAGRPARPEDPELQDPGLQDLQAPDDFATLLQEAADRFPLLVFDALEI